MLYYECGAPGAIAGIVSWTVPSEGGVMDPDYLARRILKESDHTPRTALICVENTHNRAGGAVVPLEAMASYRQLANKSGIKVHLDGARIFNAAIALGCPASEIAQYADSVSFCLSKGLRSPVGSLLCGSEDFVAGARRWRKRLGGGMRQSGILAACGIVSLTKMVDRLADDHARAKKLAAAAEKVPGWRVDMAGVQTNMVLVETTEPAGKVQDDLHGRGIWCYSVAPNRLRMVLHADIDDAKLDRAISILCDLS